MSKNARSRLWSRWLSRKPAAELPVRSLGMETLEDRLAPATFTWDGGGANALWSTAANWQNDIGPAQLTYRTPTPLTVTTTLPGQPGQNEVQTFLVPGEDGTFTLATNVTGTINGQPVTPNVGNRIASNVDLTTLQTLFNTAYGSGNTILSVVTQTGGDRLFTVQFRNTLAATNIPQLSGVYTPTIDLVFAAGTPRAATQNDLQTGTVLNQITVQGLANVAGTPTPYSITEAPDTAVNSVVLGTGSPASGNFTVQAGSGQVTYSLPTTLATNGDQSIRVDGSGSVLSMTASLTGSVQNNLNKDGPGQLNLTAANPDLLGGVKVNQGVLQIRHVQSLGPAGGTETVVGTGAGLYLNNVATAGAQTTIGEQVRLNGGGFDTIKGALFLESGTATWSGQVILETGITSPPQAGGPGTVIGAGVDVAGNPLVFTITGVLSDSGAGMGLVKEGAGEVRLGSTTGNTYRGQTNVNNGTLTATHSLSLGDSRQTNPGAFQNPTAGTVVNVSPGRQGQLRLEAPVGGPAVKIVGEYLVLNGRGNDFNGSLYSTRGVNTWAGSVILGSSVPDGDNVTIGVDPPVSPATPANLTISGVVSDPFSPVVGGVVNPWSLTKVGGGRLILTNTNTYRGTTTINAGAIVIRDSQALGPVNGGFQTGTATTPGAPVGETIVNAGAALELDVEAAYAQSVVPRYDDLNRDTWLDSVTNDAQSLTISEKLTLNGRGPGATDFGTGTTSLQSTGGTGALRSWTGINTWAARISLRSGEASIGVELDGSRQSVSGLTNRPGHPLPDSSYFRDDYSLTIQDPATTGTIGIDGTRSTDFVKVGQGHLILPQANPYFGRTLIEQGWVTIQNNRSLGDVVPDTSLGDTAQQPTVVSAGAALHITPTTPGVQLNILEENIVIEGLGIGSLTGQEQHPYSFINQKGALVNVGGDNSIAGDVGLVSTGYGTASERGAGIGVEQATTVESPVGSGNFVTLPSRLTINGDLSDGITYQRSFNNNTSPAQLNGTGTRIFNVNATQGRISVPYNFGTTAQRLQIYYPDASSAANLIYDTGDVTPGGVTGVGLATVNFGSATSTGRTVVVVVTPGAFAITPAWQVGVANIANNPRGIVTQFPSSFVKLGSETLELRGAGSQAGKKNEVREGTLLLRNDTGLGRATTGTEITQQKYDVTETVVASGATLQLSGSVAPNEGGVEAGLHIQDERLTLNQYGVQIRIAGQPTARFRLTYGGAQTDLLQVPAGYTGPPGTYAAYLQNQINTRLPNIAGDLIAGVPGATPADAAAVVTELTPGVYSVTFGAARFNPFDFSAFGSVIEPINLPTVTSLAEVQLSGSNAPLVNVSDDNTWRGPVTLNSGTRIEVQRTDLGGGNFADSRLSLLGDILEGALPTAPGSDLVKRGAGDMILGGAASTYRGVTYIDQGIVTAVSSRAFGAASTGNYDPVLTVAPGGTKVKDNAQLQVQGSITIAGEGLAVEGDGTPNQQSIDTTVRWLSVGPDATNNGVAPPYTPPTLGAPTSGRVDSISTDPTDPRVIYVATAGGGAWKTKDGGLTWIALFDQGVGTNNGALPLPSDASVASVTNLLPRSAMMFSGHIAVAPSNPQWVYYATGDANGEFTGIPNTGQTDNYAGSGVYLSKDGGKTWERLLDTDGTNPLYGQAVTKMIVDPVDAFRVYVASGTVRTVPVTAFQLPAIPTSVNNGSTNAATQAGVWRFTPTDAWVNLTGQSSAPRRAVGQAPYDVTAPNNAGPDDDFRIRFPAGTTNSSAESATWSDIVLVPRGINPNNPARMQYTLYAALGESTQTYFLGATSQAIRNAIYRTDTPEMDIADAAAPGPSWWLGRGTYFPLEWTPDRAYAATLPDRRGGEFDVGVIPPPNPSNPPWPGKYGYIKIAAASTADEVFTEVPPGSGNWLRTEHANITLYVAGLWRDPYRLDSNGLPVPIDADRGEIRELSKSITNTITPNIAGTLYTAVPSPTNPFGQATGTSFATQRPATGRYNFTFTVRDYDARTIADNNPNELFMGGLDSLHRSVDGSTSWQVVQPDAAGFAPAEQHHAIAFDTSNRLLVGTDGGLWRWDRLRFSNLNSNLPVVQFSAVDPHPTDFRQAVGGSSSSGTQLWNGNTTDGSTGSWGRVDDLSTTPNAGESGSVSGIVRYDPFNPNIIFAVRDGILRRSQDAGRTWTSLAPLGPGVTGFTGGNNNSLPTSSPLGYDKFPLVVDPLTPNRLLIGGLVNLNPPTQAPNIVTRLMESTNGGESFTNLNTAGLDALYPPPPPGIPPTVFIPRAIALAGYQGAFVNDPRFLTVTEGLSNTPDPRTIYVTDGTLIGVTKNRGVSWQNATLPLPAGGTITDIIVNPVNRDEVYATVSVRNGTAGGRIWRSTDAGQNWTNLTGTFDPDATFGNDVGPLPNIPTWKAAIDPRTGTLYVGNDNGVWELVDANATDPANVARTAVVGGGSVLHWRRVGDGLPNVQVRDIVINQTNNTLTVATYGRGAFQLFLTDYAANSGAVRVVSGQSRWTGPVVLTGDTVISAVGTQQIQNGLSAASIDFGGTISDGAGGPHTITKIGRGTVIFSGANSYAGVTDVQEGVLEVKDPNALGSAAGNTIVRYGSALQVRSDIELEPITINGDGIPFDGHFTGALRNVSGNNTYNGPLTLGTETFSAAPDPVDLEPNQVTIGVDSGSTLKIGQNPFGQNPSAVGTVSGQTAAMGFNKELPGTLILSSDNTSYLGLTRVFTGAVEVRADEALGPVGGSQPTRVSDGAAVRIANNTDLPNGPTPTVVATESLFLSGTGTPDGPGGVGTGALRNTGGNNTWNGPIQLTDIPNFAPTTNPGHQIAFGVTSASDILSVGPAVGITENFAQFGQFGLIKVGPGVLRLTTANQYTGVTNINEGTVRAAQNDALGVNDTSSEVQTIRVFGGGAGAAGQYQLTVNGNPTGVLTSNPAGASSTAAQVQAALEAVIAGAGPDVFVSSTENSNGNVYTVTFRGRFAGQNVPQIGFANVPPAITVTIATAQEGGLGTVVASGASLEVDGNGLNVSETLTINGPGVTDPDGIRYGALGNRGPAGSSNTYSGTVTFGTATAVGAQAGSDLLVTGRVLGQPTDPLPTPGPTVPAAAELTKVGYGTTYFVGAKEYRGRTVVEQGALQINNAGSLGVGRNEVQRVRATGVLGTERFTLTLFGETTNPIVLQSGAAGEAAVRDALTTPRGPGLPAILDPADLVVTSVTFPADTAGAEVVFTLTFQGRVANTNVPTLTDISPSTPQSTPASLLVSTVNQGLPGTPPAGSDEVQTFVIPNQAGTFTLNGVTGAGGNPASFPFTVTLAELQTAFDRPGLALPFGGGATPNTSLTETILPGNTGRLITVTYRNASSRTNVNQITGIFTPSLRVRVDTIQDGIGAETQVVDVRNPVGLQYRLSYTNPVTGQVVNGTRLIGSNATALDFQNALTDSIGAGGLGINPNTVRVARYTSAGGLQYLVQFTGTGGGGDFSNLNVLPLTFEIVNGGANIVVTTLQDGYEGTVVNNGASLQVENTTAAPLVLTSEWLTINGQGRNDAQSLTVTPAAAPVTYTLSYVNPLTGLPVAGTRVLTVGDTATPVPTPSSSAAEFLAALTDPVSAGGLGIAAADVLVTRVVNDVTGAVTYQVLFTGGLTARDVQLLTTVGGPAFVSLEAGNGGALRVLDGVGNSVTQWGSGAPATGSPLILGSDAAIGVASDTDVLRLLLPTTDRNPYSAPTTVLGPTNVRGPNQGFALTKVGAGTLEFNAAGDNDYTGSTFVNDGTLLLNHTGAGSHNAVLSTLVIGDGLNPAGTAAAAPESQTAVVRLAASNQIADAPTVTVNADGLLDLHGYVETIGNLTINAGVVDTEVPAALLPAAPAFPTPPAGADNGLGVADLTTGTIDMTRGRLTVRDGDDLVAGNVTTARGLIEIGVTGPATGVVGTITATSLAQVDVADGASLTSSTIRLSTSLLRIGTAAGSNATVATNGASVTAEVGSEILTGTNSVLDLRTAGGAPRGALTLNDSRLNPRSAVVTGVDLFTGAVSLTNSVLDLGNGPSAQLNTGGATIDVINSRLVTGSGGTTVSAGNVNVNGPASTGGAAATELAFGPNTLASLGTLTVTNADLDVGANAAVSTTGAVTLTDATADFLNASSLTTTAGGLTLTRSTLTGTSGVDISTQAVLVQDNSTLSLGTGTAANPATLNTNGFDITVNASTLRTGTTPDQTTPATLVTGTGDVIATGSVIELGAGTTSNVDEIRATSSTVTTGANSFTNSGTVTLTASNLTYGADSTNVVTGDFSTVETPAVVGDTDVLLQPDSTTTVTGSFTATGVEVVAEVGADLTTGPMALTDSFLRLRDGATVSTTTLTLTGATATLDRNSVLSASGDVMVLFPVVPPAPSPTPASAILRAGGGPIGTGTFALTGTGTQTITVADGDPDEDFLITSGLTQSAGQVVVKAGPGRLTLEPNSSVAFLTTPLRVQDGDVQVNNFTGPVEVSAPGTVSGNGGTGPITAASGTVSPGNGWGADRTGVLTANGDVAFGAASTLFLDIGGNGTSGTGTQAPGVHYDQLYVTGNVTIAAGATLTGQVDTTQLRLANRFVVLRATGTITGEFAESATAPGFVFIDGYKFNIDYVVDPSTGDNLVVLDKALIATTTTLTSTNDFNDPSGGSPSTLNQPVTFTAQVVAEPGGRVPPAVNPVTYVDFFDNVGVTPTLLGRVAITADGKAVLPGVILTTGTHTITAVYVEDGDAVADNNNFAESVSNPLTQIVEQPAVSIQSATPTPAPLSPNNPTSVGVNDTLTLTVAVTQERSAYTPTLRVSNGAGTVYQLILDPTTTPAVPEFSGQTVGRAHPGNTTTFTATWDGTRNVAGSGFVPDGDYQVMIVVTDERGNTFSSAAVTVRVDNTTPTTTGTVDALVINPGNATPPPAAETTFTGTITDDNPGTWTVTVAGPGGFVRSYSGTGTTVNVTWNGTDASSVTQVPDGKYTLTLTTTDAAGNNTTSAPVVRTVYVIRTAPTVTLTSGFGTNVGATTYGQAVTLNALVELPAFVESQDVTTLLSGRPVTFDFPGTGTLNATLPPTGPFVTSVVVPLNLPAGTYSPITATFPATAELPAGTTTGSHTVNRARLDVVGLNATRAYAEANPAFTYAVELTDLQFADGPGVVTGTPTTAAVESSNVGGYAITQGTVSALPNYDVVFTNGSLSITPVPLTIRVNDATRARFGQNPPFTATYDGFKLSDGPSVVNNLNLVTDAQTNSPTGTYRIFSSTQPSATNYFSITVTEGVLTVTGSPNVTVVGSGEGSPPQAQVLSPAGEKLQNIPFDASFGGGVRTAAGDFNKDGVADYVIGSGPGRRAFVQVIDGSNGATLFQAFPFENFDGGTFVAAGDMTGDGIAELVVTPDEGGGPRVVVFRGGDFAPLVSYFAIDDAGFRGGVRPAVGDINGDGFADLAVSAGFGGGPRISIWDGQSLGKLEFARVTDDFFAYEDTLRNGAFVSLGDVNGDGLADLIAGAGPGGGPRVKIYDGKSLLSTGGAGATVFANFFAGNEANRGGVKVAAKNLDGDKFIDLVTGGGKGDRAVATAYRGSALVVNSPDALYEFDLDGTLNGVFVG